VNLCLRTAMKRCNELGISLFDFEGSMVPGIEAFFRKFGSKLRLRFVITSAAVGGLPDLCNSFGHR
jgi:hypothetical protein